MAIIISDTKLISNNRKRKIKKIKFPKGFFLVSLVSGNENIILCFEEKNKNNIK